MVAVKAGVIYYKDSISGKFDNQFNYKQNLKEYGFSNNEYLRKKRIEYYDKLNKKE